MNFNVFLLLVPRVVNHDSYMDEFDWFCYFPSRNFLGTTNPLFNYPYIGKNVWTTQYGTPDGWTFPIWMKTTGPNEGTF